MFEKFVDAKDVEVEISGLKVKIKGERGELERDFSDPRYAHAVCIEKRDDKIRVYTYNILTGSRNSCDSTI